MGQSELECRFCRTPLKHTFVDLGASPLANSFLSRSALSDPEPFYPLHIYVCSSCFLVQLAEISSPGEIFADYAYFSSFSASWLDHAGAYARDAVRRFSLDSSDFVVEIGSNDGYLLRFFRELGIPALGIEPAENVARAAQKEGLETLVRFFDSALAAELSASGRRADLIVGNNVLAHIPAIGELMKGLKLLLKPGGVISMEFPHLLSLIEQNQFDTIYHEHYSYYSLTAADAVFSAYKLNIFDVDLLPTHGGSLRIYAGHSDGPHNRRSESFNRAISDEEEQGLKDISVYSSFESRVRRLKREILKFLITARDEGKTVAAYGAPAKGNTLLNYCGIGPDFIDYTVDISPHKQGLYLPGSRIPVYAPEKVAETKPDYLIILPWNLREEIVRQMGYIKEWGGSFVTLVPDVEIF